MHRLPMIGMVIYGDKVPAGGVSNVVKAHIISYEFDNFGIFRSDPIWGAVDPIKSVSK